MARVVRFHRFGGPEVLRIDEVAVEPPGPGEVRLQVRAIGLNRAEALFRSGRYIETPAAFPARLGLEAAGVVEALGPGVAGFAIGDAVSVAPPISMVRWPAHGELATFPAAHIIAHPPTLSWEAAAALWMPYLTAYGALVELARLRAGEVVAITAASSSVGLAAIQIARRVGATPVAVTRTKAKAAALFAHGAAYVIATADQALDQALIEIAGPDGTRVVLDAVGGPAVEVLAAAMAPGGMLIEYGGLSPQPTPFPLGLALGKTLTMRGYLVHEVIRDPARLADAIAFTLEGLACGAFAPTISRTFAFEDIVEAHRYLESNGQFGKVVATL